MSIVSVMNMAKGAAFRTALVLKKHAPQILIATGIASGVMSTGFAIRGTVVALDILKEHDTNKEKINSIPKDSVHTVNGKKITYTEDIRNQDLKTESANTVIRVMKAYAPAVGLGILSITATLGGYRILSTRFATCAAALNAVTKSFHDYRKRVALRYGDEVEHQIMHNLDDNGKPHTTTIENEDGTVDVVEEKPEYSIYMKVFDKGNPNYAVSSELNQSFLRNVEHYMNDRLRLKGHVFLNEVYDALGFNRTRLGSIAGWTYDKRNPIGDNAIDFGLDGQGFRDFINGYNDSVILDFNVQGSILNDLETHQFTEG